MTLDSALNIVLVLGVVLGGIGYAMGQFLSQRRKGAGEALSVALQEVSALKIRADRLAYELEQVRTDMRKLHAENQTLRNLLSGGTFLAEQIRVLIQEEVEKGAHLTVDLLKQP